DPVPLAPEELALLEVLRVARRVADRDGRAHGGAAEGFRQELHDAEARAVAADEVVEAGALVDPAGDVAVDLREAPAAGRAAGVVARKRDRQAAALALDHPTEEGVEAVE